MKAVNLLPADSRPSRRNAGDGSRLRSPRQPLPVAALAVLGVLAGLVVAVVMIVLAGNQVRGKQDRLAALKVQEQVAGERIARLQVYGTFRQLAADRLSTVRQLADSRFGWEQTLRDLSRAIPGNVTVASITGSVAPGAAGATSANPLRASRSVPALELSGCTRDHDSVARLMARMRTVRGVSRVAIASSTKKPGVAATPDPAGTAEPTGCGVGDSAGFELVMFFEGAKSATATGSGATTPTATPTPSGTPAPGASPTPSASSTPAAGATPAPTASPSANSTPAPAGDASVNQGGTSEP